MLVLSAYYTAINDLCPAVLKAMIVGNQESFIGICFYDLVRINIPPSDLTEYNITYLIIRGSFKSEMTAAFQNG